MRSSSSAPRGVLIAGLGAVVALASLWLPWYTIKLPEAFKEMLGSLGGGAGGAGSSGTSGAGQALGGLFKGLAGLMPSEITGKGWQVMNGGDIGIAVAAVGALLLVLALAGTLGSGVRIERSSAGRLIAIAGLVVAAVAVYHVVNKPGTGAGSLSGVVTVKTGIWVALLGGALMVGGGIMTASAPAVTASESLVAEPVAASEMSEPSAAPAVDPFAAPVVEHADAFAAPVVEHADPFAAPSSEPEPYGTPYPSSEPEPYGTPYPSSEPEPYATPYPSSEPLPQWSPQPAADAEPLPRPEPEPVPEWSGFSTPVLPESPIEPEPVAVGSEAAPAPRPAGVSIPPPGWSGG